MAVSRSRLPAPLTNPLALATLIVLTVTLTLYLFKFHGNIYGFFRIGTVLPFSPYLNLKNALIYNGELGFDGQQFLSVAFDPFLNNPDTILTLDSPRLRYRRILYPLLGYLFGFGNPNLIPYVLVVINIVSILGLIWVLERTIKLINPQRAWQSLLILCLPGVWIVLSFSGADLLNSFLVMAVFYAYQIQKFRTAAIALSLALFAKETSAMMGVALLIDSIRKRQGRAILYLLAAYLPAFLWNLYVLIRLKSQGFLGVSVNFVFPFSGFYEKIVAMLQGGLTGKNIFEAYTFFTLIAVYLANFYIFSQHPRGNRIILHATLLYGLLFVSSSMAILEYFLSYPRVYVEACYLLLLSEGERFNPLRISLMAATGLSSLAFLVLHT